MLEYAALARDGPNKMFFKVCTVPWKDVENNAHDDDAQGRVSVAMIQLTDFHYGRDATHKAIT